MTQPGLPPLASEELPALLAQLGAVLLSNETLATTIDLVTTLAGHTIPGTVGAGVTLIDERGKRSTSATDPLVEKADAIQYRLDAGPCLTAWRDQTVIRVDDATSETRWPSWGAAVAELGVRSLLSVPLLAGGISVGAIKVYGTERYAYDDRAEQLLQLFAAQAAILLSNTITLTDARQTGLDLISALENRDLIGQAKGVLLAQGAIDSDAAYAMLVSASQRSNTKLHEVARQLVTSVTERHPRT